MTLGKAVILVGPIPYAGYNLASRGKVISPLCQSRRVFDAQSGHADEWLARGAANMIAIRPSTLFCDASRCSFLLDGQPAFSDHNHLSKYVMDGFVPLFAKGLDEAIPESQGLSHGSAAIIKASANLY